MNLNTPENNLPSLAALFAEIRDQRKPKGVRYEFHPLLILLSLAKFCEQDTPSRICDWVENRGELLKEKLGLDWKRMPSLSTWQRLIGENIEAEQFDEKICWYFQTLDSGERELYNLDGKVVCRSVDKHTNQQLHLLALQESESNLVVEQTPLKAGENEISAAKRLLETARLTGKIISGDAIFAQSQLSQTVVAGGGEYLWKLRANQGTMYELAREHFAAKTDRYVERAVTVEKAHGRIEEREILTSFRLAAQMEFPAVAQVFRIRRKSEQVKTGKVSEQVIYAITSLPVEEFGAAQLLDLTRRHWRIENGLHYRRDVTFQEDASRQTSKNGGRVLAVLNNLTIGILRKLGWENIAKARRYFNARIEEGLNLIMTPANQLL